MRNFTKEMLVASMVIVRRNGTVKVVANAVNPDGTSTLVFVDNSGTHKYMRLDRFNDDLTHVTKDKFDVVQVFSVVGVDCADLAAEADTSTRALLWTEEEPVTVDETSSVQVTASDVTITIPADIAAAVATLLQSLVKSV